MVAPEGGNAETHDQLYQHQGRGNQKHPDPRQGHENCPDHLHAGA
jgi:hypothetical protein